ncbi:MAG: nickel-dependent lactate racemase [Acidobacteria bacterium]|nr:nickel-dependent lactate racemase [Acidobacteriota bacterium]
MHFSVRYGNSQFSFDAPEEDFEVLGRVSEANPLSDAQIGASLDQPIGSPALEEIVGPGESVLIVVPDATRSTACDSIVNLLVRRLIANGTAPYEISIIFATGIHRRVTPEEKRKLLTPFIFQRIKTLDHNARDLMQLAGFDSDKFVSFGEIGNEPVELNRALVDNDHIILVGGIAFHYFAGFTGGRKLVCPGLASARTIAATHRLAFDFDKLTRREGVGPGLLDRNPVHEAFLEVASNVAPSFAINTIVNDHGEAIEVFCGDWKESHRTGCETFAADHTVSINERRDVVIASCGGSPFDLNMIQAHKTLEAASRACRDGGTIVLIAECVEGLGRPDFLKWFNAANSMRLAELLRDGYEVNGQTAWSLLEKAERFDIRIVTLLDESETSAMRLKKVGSFDELLVGKNGYILPSGGKLFIAEKPQAGQQ